MNACLPRAPLLVLLLAPLLTAGSAGDAGQDRAPVGLRFVWSHPVLAGKSKEADALVFRMQSYLQANHPRRGLYQLRDYNPERSRSTWIMNFTNAPEMESTMAQLDAEEGWQALVAEQEQVLDLELGWFRFMLPVVQRDPPGPPLSFWWRRNARVAPPELARALRLARAEAEYVNANYPAVRMEVYAGVERDLGWLFWFCEFGSPDVWRETQTRLWADDGYLELMEAASGLFDAESWAEQIDVIP